MPERSVSDDPIVSHIAEKVLLMVPQPYTNHKGSMVEFARWVSLFYIALGDRNAAGDPLDRGQNREELLGKILRIDVDQGDPPYHSS